MKKLMALMTVVVAALSAQANAFDVEAKYNSACVFCHNPAATVPPAPSAFNAEAWAPRLSKGMDTLVKHVTEGFNTMPPRGMCMDCTADNYKALITYMSTAK